MVCVRRPIFFIAAIAIAFIGDATFTQLIVNYTGMGQFKLGIQLQNIKMYWCNLMRIKLMIIVWISLYGVYIQQNEYIFQKAVDRQHFPMAQINNEIENY